MTNDQSPPSRPGRRGFLKAGGAAVAAGAGLATSSVTHAALTRTHADDVQRQIEPFYGAHQGGVVTPQQSHSYLAAFDLKTDKREEVIALLREWTQAAARMTQGKPAGSLETADDKPAADSADVLGLGASSLTITFGFGPGLFTSRDGKDRYGLASKRPAALVDLPRFNGDQLIAEKTGGDLFVQACANDAQVAFHAVRQLARMGYGAIQMRWGQAGFLSGPKGQTPRNLMGFKDGTNNPSTAKPPLMNQFVWANAADAPWMQGGTYTVVRRIRITLEHWDQMELGFQEQVFGRHKYSGAPIGQKNEFDAVDLKAVDKDGNPVIPDNSHVRLSNQANNAGAQILRRSYSYNDGTNFYIERWPPWRQETEYDAGLIFIAHQADPRTGFIPINEKLSKFDVMNQFTTHIGSAIFAVPPGAREGSYVGAGLFEA
ncbi:iron uptake transporter deferrochelatase/peroxidase subunit [Paraburkholderia hospita]|uniref:Deferrochelatase n=1 Tax=Paraburkholderia hospita TaxID=169430 RepID=A0AAN1JEQ2_9BURK|nr:iron uptake transporter deferrochelatase/peroxidase subunit [Paraburkholderia hospita]AUT72496.1 deferrochelatase/peroxidase EfeB [Paraburkholderia hospita]EIN00847.1 Dyp-type peroxidase family protein [Paraburkholderia hospita]OUL76009.1 deferrochelatase/peroxidase EfeB [Paraburkholderia hospita]OUL76815.1 deferrochelatase/peroxidase EfeB [Paraburkholderia hospita]SEI00226.1 deferrochelatase/peroxidase EfeB [Paraburkholderia hospita]